MTAGALSAHSSRERDSRRTPLDGGESLSQPGCDDDDPAADDSLSGSPGRRLRPFLTPLRVFTPTVVPSPPLATAPRASGRDIGDPQDHGDRSAPYDRVDWTRVHGDQRPCAPRQLSRRPRAANSRRRVRRDAPSGVCTDSLSRRTSSRRRGGCHQTAPLRRRHACPGSLPPYMEPRLRCFESLGIPVMVA